jgi:hypothetical protein
VNDSYHLHAAPYLKYQIPSNPNMVTGCPAGSARIFVLVRTAVGTARKLPITDMNRLNVRLVLPM